MIMKCNSTLYWHAALLYSVNYSLFTLTSIFWSHYLITLSKSPFPLINPTLSFICDPLFRLPSLILFTPFLSFSFAAHWCLFFFRGWLDYPCWNSCYSDFRSSTKSIRGKITPFFFLPCILLCCFSSFGSRVLQWYKSSPTVLSP